MRATETVAAEQKREPAKREVRVGIVGYGTVGHSVNSFASRLHKLVREDCRVEALVLARVKKVGAAADGRKGVYLDFDCKKFAHRVPHSKIAFW